ncbi:mannitol dehydrogenase family protein [Psychrosphaera sp. 1_MG-2023]|uniref:mannitol dehydrogenase family protein n=1 Tax=Psychrosphaera sp. 1_MG-2023 TaxID=3062643 RepID=UPI0026E3A8A7|nr:mannitol dehydrogenase family protein [Psychrosphaera sp. 1_MG-2023]MDO6718660.1 mannitol dehydrogenase family protein [Psychrosphaera sp. 1_MG-2023]
MQLTQNNLDRLSKDILKPKFDRQQTQIGIVHLGPGAFFRAHQAWYTQQALNVKAGNWGICAIALNSNRVKQQLEPQQGLYTLVEQDNTTQYSIIGSVKEVLALQEDFSQVVSRLTDATTKIVTLTITEKGYCLDAKGRLDCNHPIIKRDLLNAERPESAIGLLFLACKIRHQQNTSPLTVISCDNLNDNGVKLKAALVNYAQLVDTTLADIIQTAVICPRTMVDSITPATDTDMAVQIEQQFGYKDNWPIKRETFTQWVIEDILPDDIPAWGDVGVTFTHDIAGYENAKLRVLNATHSTLAYLGHLLDIETVYSAINNEVLHTFISNMLKTEIKPSLVIPKEMNYESYCCAILQRYRNPAIKHLLSQIAWDGSQKLQVRILPIIVHNIKHRIPIKSCCFAVAAWMRFVIIKSRNKSELIDPLNHQLLAISSYCCDSAEQDVAHFMALELFSGVADEPDFIAQVTQAYRTLCQVPAAILSSLVSTN